MMRIAVDAFGGDNAPDEIVKGSVAAACNLDCEIILVGDETILKQKLTDIGYTGDKISIRHASEVISGDESPVDAIRHKRDASIMVALRLCKNKEADAVVSAGNTGAYFAGAFRTLGRIKGIRRPALTAFMPTVNKTKSVMMDVGANADCKPENLAQFAQMGSLYAEKILGIANPKVYLVNIGTEEQKGNELSQKAYALLKENKNINFCGNIESRELTTGFADVIICDGFTGNVIIKAIEGTSSALFGLLKKSFMKTLTTKISALMMKPHIKSLKSMLDYSEYGGVPLLGIDGVVVKAHGSSNAKAFENAIKSAIVFAETGLNDELRMLYAQKNEVEPIVSESYIEAN